MYEISIGTNESFVVQHTGHWPRGFHHLSRQGTKIVELARLDCQLDVPRNLIAHVTPGSPRETVGSLTTVISWQCELPLHHHRHQARNHCRRVLGSLDTTLIHTASNLISLMNVAALAASTLPAIQAA